MVVLAVDVDEEFADGADHARGGGLAVDGERGAPGGEKLARDEELVARGNRGVDERADLLGNCGIVQLKHPRDAGFVCPGPDRLGPRGLHAKENLKGPENEAFPRAGLASEAVEAFAKFDGDVFDDGEIRDVKFSQHLRIQDT